MSPKKISSPMTLNINRCYWPHDKLPGVTLKAFQYILQELMSYEVSKKRNHSAQGETKLKTVKGKTKEIRLLLRYFSLETSFTFGLCFARTLLRIIIW